MGLNSKLNSTEQLRILHRKGRDGEAMQPPVNLQLPHSGKIRLTDLTVSHNQNGAKHQLSNLAISFFKSPLTSKISNKNLHSDSQFLKFEEVSDFTVYFTIN